MTIRTTLIASSLIAASLVSGAAQAALEGRDLDGNIYTAEAYYDTDLNITWLADANGKSEMDWATANSWAANLSFTNGVNIYDNWRLPTVSPVNGTSINYELSFNGSTDRGYNITSLNSEMSHMFFVTLGNPSIYTPAGEQSGCYVHYIKTCLDNVGPFSDLAASGVYWSATEYTPLTNGAWFFAMHFGIQDVASMSSPAHAWAVSDGNIGIAAIPEPETYAMMLAGLGLVGFMAKRRKQIEA